MAANVGRILDELRAALPSCTLYLQTALPRHPRWTTKIKALNQRYAELARARGIQLIDLYPLFDDGSGRLRKDFTNDDLHLLGAGYSVWREAIAGFVTGKAD